MTIINHLQIKVIQHDSQKLVLQMPITEKHLQPFGFLHGGVSLLLAETAASMGANAKLTEDEFCVGQQLNGHHLKAKQAGACLYAHATCQFHGKTSQVWQINILDEVNELVCLATCTLSIKKHRQLI